MTEIDRMVAEVRVRLADSEAADPGMVLVTVGCFTGYTPTQESLDTLTAHAQVRGNSLLIIIYHWEVELGSYARTAEQFWGRPRQKPRAGALRGRRRP